jgi:hypothetical protein
MRLFPTLSVPLALFLSAAAVAGTMPFWGAKSPVPIETPSDRLKPGEFTWAPQVAPAGPITVLVSLDEQRAYAYRNGVLIGLATISSGKRGHETPTGVFTTTLKDKNHHSSKYNNAPMPYTQRFTSDGVALHAGGLPGYPESHGCVHLPSEFARLLFDASPVGMTVVVADHKSAPENVDHPPFLAPITDKGELAKNRRLLPDETVRWEPGKSPEGPVSILLSGYDSRAVVLRNGVEIGRARISIAERERPLGTHVYVVKDGGGAAPGRTPDWIGVGIVGHMDDAGTHPSPDGMKRIAIPDSLLRQVHPLLMPGTTLMVTDAPILEHTTGVQLAVLSSHPGE